MPYELLDAAPAGRYEVLDAAPAKEAATLQNIKQGAGNVLAGAVRGAGSIGATLMAPWDMMTDAIQGKGLSLESNRQRRADMDAALQSLGADPQSLLYQGGKLAGEIAGTAGTGGLVGGALKTVPALAKFAPVVQSGGMTLGPANTGSYAANLALRMAGGAANGAATSALINPESAGEGAVAGAALPALVKGAQYAGKIGTGLAKNILGRTTGTSPETLGAAFQAGRQGNPTFVQNMRGEGEFGDVVDAAKAGLDKMRLERGAQYRSGMMDISADKSILDFKPIDTALQQLQNLGSYKGVQINKNAAGVVDDIAQKVGEWRALDPAEYHTPEGFDALKKAIGDIRDSTQFGTQARRAADSIYNAVKGEITQQAPTYSKVMGDYEAASEQLSQIERGLSLGDKTSQDTAIRKLQSLMRNNAQSNYGNRLSLARQLEQQGGVDLTPAIAGQALNTWTPRGMSGALQVGGLGVGAGLGLLNPATLATAPFFSPRMVGEAAYGAGLLSGGVGRAAGKVPGLLGATPEARQIGRGLLTTLPIAISASQTARQ